MIPVIVIEGPTASGKSAFAIQLAKQFDTEIISADSRQIYRFLDIGTAKPTNDELAQVRHHLISIINPDECFNAGLFRDKAINIINALRDKGKIPIICGGTGLYVKALLDGLFQCDANDISIRNQLEKEYLDKGLGFLYDELNNIDPEVSKSISCNDKQRIMRALEVYRITGIPLSLHWKNQDKKNELTPFRILLDEERDILYKRIDQRISDMLEAGLLMEIASLFERGYTWFDPGLNSVGYKEFKAYFENSSTMDDCILKAQQHSRNYAKRQITWYNKCSFNLTERHTTINMCIVGDVIKSYFDIKLFEEINGYSC